MFTMHTECANKHIVSMVRSVVMVYAVTGLDQSNARSQKSRPTGTCMFDSFHCTGVVWLLTILCNVIQLHTIIHFIFVQKNFSDKKF